MRAFVAAVAICACAAVLLGAAIVALAIELLPYVTIGCAIAVLITSRRHAAPVRQHAYRHLPLPPAPQYRAPAGQWVYLPVWVGAPPRPAMPVIDAEVIEDQR
jgi:hypothetical protein